MVLYYLACNVLKKLTEFCFRCDLFGYILDSRWFHRIYFYMILLNLINPIKALLILFDDGSSSLSSIEPYLLLGSVSFAVRVEVGSVREKSRLLLGFLPITFLVFWSSMTLPLRENEIVQLLSINWLEERGLAKKGRVRNMACNGNDWGVWPISDIGKFSPSAVWAVECSLQGRIL